MRVRQDRRAFSGASVVNIGPLRRRDLSADIAPAPARSMVTGQTAAAIGGSHTGRLAVARAHAQSRVAVDLTKERAVGDVATVHWPALRPPRARAAAWKDAPYRLWTRVARRTLGIGMGNMCHAVTGRYCVAVA